MKARKNWSSAMLVMTTAGLVTALASSQMAKAGPIAMRPTDVNGYDLVDAQYLPFRGHVPPRYPADVLFGFYPPGVTDEATACAVDAFKRVLELFYQNPPTLRAVSEFGATRRFILWINDYSRSDQRPSYRPSWFHHAGVAGDYRQGSWVWEATLLASGACLQPTEQQIGLALAAAAVSLRNHWGTQLVPDDPTYLPAECAPF